MNRTSNNGRERSIVRREERKEEKKEENFLLDYEEDVRPMNLVENGDRSDDGSGDDDADAEFKRKLQKLKAYNASKDSYAAPVRRSAAASSDAVEDEDDEVPLSTALDRMDL